MSRKSGIIVAFSVAMLFVLAGCQQHQTQGWKSDPDVAPYRIQDGLKAAHNHFKMVVVAHGGSLEAPAVFSALKSLNNAIVISQVGTDPAGLCRELKAYFSLAQTVLVGLAGTQAEQLCLAEWSKNVDACCQAYPPESKGSGKTNTDWAVCIATANAKYDACISSNARAKLGSLDPLSETMAEGSPPGGAEPSPPGNPSGQTGF